MPKSSKSPKSKSLEASILPKLLRDTYPEGVSYPLMSDDVYRYAQAAALLDGMNTDAWISREVLRSAGAVLGGQGDELGRLERRIEELDGEASGATMADLVILPGK